MQVILIKWDIETFIITEFCSARSLQAILFNRPEGCSTEVVSTRISTRCEGVKFFGKGDNSAYWNVWTNIKHVCEEEPCMAEA